MKEHKIIEKDGKKYLACNECWVIKELVDDFWVRSRSNKHWFVYKCKDCLYKKWREAQHKYYLSHKEKVHNYNMAYNKSHREEIREKRRWNREKENEKRRLRMKEISKKTYEHSKEMWHAPLHKKVARIIKKLWIRPKECSICGYEWLIVAHHPDYSKWNEVVFCCNSCHRLIHRGLLNTTFKITKICEALWERELIHCDYCWVPMQNNWRKHCESCKKIAMRDAHRKYINRLHSNLK